MALHPMPPDFPDKKRRREASLYGGKMKCPECGAWSTVVETRSSPVRYRRRRECGNGHNFTTEEVVVPPEKIEEESNIRLRTYRQKYVESVRESKTRNIRKVT